MKLLQLLLLCFLAFSCKRKQAEWQSEWQAPLINDTLNLEQLEQNSLVSIDAGNYMLDFDREIFRFTLSDFVKIPDTTIIHNYSPPLSINVNPGVSFVNDINENNIDLGDVQLKKITIKSGGINLKVNNPLTTKAIFTVNLPGVSKYGAPFQYVFTAPEMSNGIPGSVSVFLDLSGFDLDLRGQLGGSYNKLQSKLTVQSDPNGSVTTVSNQDVFQFIFSFQSIRLAYARGYFGTQLFEKTQTENIEFLNAIQSGMLNVDAANLNFNIENGLKLAARFKLHSLQNTNAQNSTVSLTHSDLNNWLYLDPANEYSGTYVNGDLDFAINGGNCNFENIIENHGAKNTFQYSLETNPWGNTSGGWDEIYDEHPLIVRFAGTMPLNIGMNELTLVDTFDFKPTIKREDIINEGTIWIKTTNAFPFSADLAVSLLDENNQLIAVLPVSGKVNSASLGTMVNGILQRNDEVSIQLTAEAMLRLKDVRFIRIASTFNSVNTANVNTQMNIPEKAFLGIKIGARLKIVNAI